MSRYFELKEERKEEIKRKMAETILNECDGPLTPKVVRLFGVFECCVEIGRSTLDLNWLLSELSETVLQALYGKADWRSNLHSDLNDLNVGERLVLKDRN